MRYKIRELKKNIDDRGILLELLRSDEVGQFNQIYTANIKPGKERGGHYHKVRKEWFCVIKGEGRYELHDLLTGGKDSISIKESDFKQIELPPMIYHKVINTGDQDLIFVSAISDLYNKDNPDTYKE